jgi:hypothetical protein
MDAETGAEDVAAIKDVTFGDGTVRIDLMDRRWLEVSLKPEQVETFKAGCFDTARLLIKGRPPPFGRS